MIENVSTQLTVFHCFAHCLLPGRAFASLYALLFLEKEAEIGGRVKLSNKIMVSSWMGDPMVCMYSSWIVLFQVEFFEVNFRWNFAVNPFRFFGKISTWKKIPGGKICIFHLILLLYIAFHLYSISCEGEKNPPVFF